MTLHAAILLICILIFSLAAFPQERQQYEYLWIEAENMNGFSRDALGAPVVNASWLDLPKSKAPGWGMNGPGVSAEWSQGGESEWNSAAASADEDRASLEQDLEIPRGGQYKIWVRYADWANKDEEFVVRLTQNKREVFRHEFGRVDIVDPHDEVSMYWGWAFTWDGAAAQLEKGPIKIILEINHRAGARRHIDCLLLTNDLAYVPRGRSKPDFAAMRYLREWSSMRKPLSSLFPNGHVFALPKAWERPRVAGADFLMPWNIAKEFWSDYDKPPTDRPLYPFNAEPLDEYIKTYKSVRDVPLFASKFVVPVIYINDLPQYLKDGSPFLRYLRVTRQPFAVLINYGAAQMSVTDGEAVWKLLNGELRNQFLGWISGESVGYVWGSAATDLKISPEMNRSKLLDAHHLFYTEAINKKWSTLFHTDTGPMWDKMIPAQSTSSTSFAHALAAWGVKLLGVETAAAQPMTAMRIAFTRGAARQYEGGFLYYHAPNFGDTATTFTKTQNFAGPDNFFHSRYGPTMGPSLSWYRKSYYLYYMSGASAIYLEQGFDQFFKPGPGEHPFQLNPLGRITDEFMRFAAKHPNRGTPYTPIAFLLDPAHGWDMTDYPHWPFEVSQINRSDRSLRELFGVAYYPGLVVEGEPATGDRQSFVSGIFGDIFDVLVSDDARREAINNYRVVVVGGIPKWTNGWTKKLVDYVRDGGVLVLNSAQIDGLPADFTGVRLVGSAAEADSAACLATGEGEPVLSGQLFRYDKIELRGARAFIQSPAGDPLVTVNKIGKGGVVFCALPDLLGEDERITPFAAHLLAHVFSDATPVKVSGDVEFLINRNDTGWVVTLFNNNGVYKPQQGLAQVDRSASVIAKISFSRGSINEATEWVSEKKLALRKTGAGISVDVEIHPGGVAIVELD